MGQNRFGLIAEPFEGQSIEKKVAAFIDMEQSIDDTAPLAYDENMKMGVDPYCDIHSDRWAMAQKAMASVDKHKRMKQVEEDEAEESEATKNKDKTVDEITKEQKKA